MDLGSRFDFYYEERVEKMEVEGRHNQAELKKLYPNWKKLDPKKVLKGQIYVITDYQDEYETRGKLILSSGAEVLAHEHTIDEETYVGIIYTSDKPTIISETCKIGGKHNLINQGNGWAVVYFVKRKPKQTKR